MILWYSLKIVQVGLCKQTRLYNVQVNNTVKKFQKILLAVDFGEATTVAVDKAGYLGKCFGAEIIPMHVVEAATFYYNAPIIDLKGIYKRNAVRMAEIKESLTNQGVKVGDPIARDGKASTIIPEEANEAGVDLIVLGAAKQKFMEKILGSTAEKVIRTASQPVFVVHPADSTRQIKNILCALDSSPASRVTLNAAISLSRWLQAKLNILHVVQLSRYYPKLGELRAPISEWGHDVVPDVVQERTSANAEIDEGEETAFRNYLKSFDLSGLDYSQSIRRGNVDDEIHSRATETESDLMVMGAIDRHGATSFFARGTIEKLVRKVPCSILTIKHSERLESDKNAVPSSGSNVS